MLHKLKEKLEKKGKKLDPLERQAKMGIVKEMGRQAGELLGDKIKPLKKVTVAADNKEDLKKGLGVAAGVLEKMPNGEGHDPEEVVEGAEEELGDDLDKDNEEGESSEHMAKVLGDEKEMEECSPEELDAKIAELQALKAKKEKEQKPY